MFFADTTVLSRSKYPMHFDHMDNGSKLSKLSKCLYNAALFRIRQVFTGWDKEERTDNEKEVFEEIRVMQAAYPHRKVRRVLSYRALDAIMRANGNPDFFAGLPMQTSQRILKEAVSVFKAWLSLHHDGFIRDMMHKVSTDIVRWCVEHGIGTLVIGTNRGWKQAVDMGRVNNRSFGSVPHDMLRKTFPDAWQGTEDFSFLAYPEAIGFKDLQRARTA